MVYPHSAFRADEDRLCVQVGETCFHAQGAHIDINSRVCHIQGELFYAPFTLLERTCYAPSMMGPFAYLPFMECNHDVISLHHKVSGSLQMEGERISLKGATGYIEKDWGRSMPRRWLWFQCSQFPREASVMLSWALVPFLGTAFPGVIAVCHCGGRQFRLATYYGAKLTFDQAGEKRYGITLRQRHLQLSIQVDLNEGHPLLAPLQGNMCRTIMEYPACPCHVSLHDGNIPLFDCDGTSAGFERVE